MYPLKTIWLRKTLNEYYSVSKPCIGKSPAAKEAGTVRGGDSFMDDIFVIAYTFGLFSRKTDRHYKVWVSVVATEQNIDSLYSPSDRDIC